VLGGFAALFVVGALVLHPSEGNSVAFGLYALALSALLVLTCYLKGEPPRWRWGK
jgi:hypothetical protein